MYRTVTLCDTFITMMPGGLASDSYNGHTFWDCETWMYPPLLAFWPSLAASALQYRYNHIAGAQVKAQSYQPPYQGVRFNLIHLFINLID